MIRLAINGFGRIGRLAFRRVMEMEEFEKLLQSTLTSPDSRFNIPAKYDSVQGVWGILWKMTKVNHSRR